MSPERWTELKGRVKDTFPIVDEGTERLENDPGTVERLVFQAPAGLLKLEFTIKPRVVGERGQGSRRIGSSIRVERLYSATENVTILKAYKRDPSSQAWVEFAPDTFLT